MGYYIVDKNQNEKGVHVVHQVTCYHLPFWWNQIDLDQNDDAESAVSKATEMGLEVKMCPYCCTNVHKADMVKAL